jgi:hypothetical protein
MRLAAGDGCTSEFLAIEIFEVVRDARSLTISLSDEYNSHPPHGSFGHRTPVTSIAPPVGAGAIPLCKQRLPAVNHWRSLMRGDGTILDWSASTVNRLLGKC